MTRADVFSVADVLHSAALRSSITPVGNLVFYREKTIGGHFPALDNPDGLYDDLRAFAALYWAV